VFLVLFASIPNLVSNIKEYIEENRDADELEDEKARALGRDDEEDGEESEELMRYEMELRKKFYDRLFCVVTAILIIIVILVLVWLQARYNILPPYGD
jgi:t-SNARE complex subunit (syntaxin)